ncbi:MAG TPA: hypothetical protein VHA74_00860 [Candidatus Dojkabacteria bacterium]|nr:hypothetical protein [Candidatus Dojkabacteria bacterium]
MKPKNEIEKFKNELLFNDFMSQLEEMHYYHRKLLSIAAGQILDITARRHNSIELDISQDANTIFTIPNISQPKHDLDVLTELAVSGIVIAADEKTSKQHLPLRRMIARNECKIFGMHLNDNKRQEPPYFFAIYPPSKYSRGKITVLKVFENGVIFQEKFDSPQDIFELQDFSIIDNEVAYTINDEQTLKYLIG